MKALVLFCIIMLSLLVAGCGRESVENLQTQYDTSTKQATSAATAKCAQQQGLANLYWRIPAGDPNEFHLIYLCKSGKFDYYHNNTESERVFRKAKGYLAKVCKDTQVKGFNMFEQDKRSGGKSLNMIIVCEDDRILSINATDRSEAL